MKNPYQKIYLDHCTSTNDVAYELGIQGAPHGSMVLAKYQTQGRGRNQHTWCSSTGNLYLSIIVRCPQYDAHTILKIPMTIAIAIAEYLRCTLDCQASIKWPNDLYLGEKKFGGILCESYLHTQNPFIVIGVGLNTQTSADPLIRAHLLPYIQQPYHDLLQPVVLADALVPVILHFINLLTLNPELLKQKADDFAYFCVGDPITWQSLFQENVLYGYVLGLTERFGLKVQIKSDADAGPQRVLELLAATVQKCRKA